MKQAISGLLLLLAFLLFFPAFLSAQSPRQAVTGFVKDNTSNEPLTGANVIVLDSDPLIGAVTDHNGKFRLENIPVGYVSILVTFVGYQTMQVSKQLPTVETILSSGVIHQVDCNGALKD